jgi:hypothetical protein
MAPTTESIAPACVISATLSVYTARARTHSLRGPRPPSSRTSGAEWKGEESDWSQIEQQLSKRLGLAYARAAATCTSGSATCVFMARTMAVIPPDATRAEPGRVATVGAPPSAMMRSAVQPACASIASSGCVRLCRRSQEHIMAARWFQLHASLRARQWGWRSTHIIVSTSWCAAL